MKSVVSHLSFNRREELQLLSRMQSLGFPAPALVALTWRVGGCVKLSESEDQHAGVGIFRTDDMRGAAFIVDRRQFSSVFLVYIASLSSSISMQIGKWLNSNGVLCIKFWRRICRDAGGMELLGRIMGGYWGSSIYMWNGGAGKAMICSHGIYNFDKFVYELRIDDAEDVVRFHP